MSDHVEDKIQAWLDGELSAGEREFVEDHCRSCSRCGEIRRERQEIRSWFQAAPIEEPVSPMWPAVETRLQGSGHISWPFFFGASAAAFAGIVLGVLLGAVADSSYEAGEGDAWSEVGSSMTIESSPGISGFYLDSEEGGDS